MGKRKQIQKAVKKAKNSAKAKSAGMKAKKNAVQKATDQAKALIAGAGSRKSRKK